MAELRIIPISRIEPNRGQIKGLPKNPRVIRNDRFEKLKDSLRDNPEMMSLRELIVYPIDGEKKQRRYIVIGGNMRLRAAQDLGFKEMPCKILPEQTGIDKLKAIVIKDNASYGRWAMNDIANCYDIQELDDCGLDVGQYIVKDSNVDTNQELDIDSFDEAMKMKFQYSEDELADIKRRILAINANPEIAVLTAAGFTQ